ncbi:MAG: histidine kinase [Cyclobacteriaceae bacterium]
MKIKIFAFSLFILLGCMTCVAQLDSLQRELKTATSDSTIAKLLLIIGDQHPHSDSAKFYWKKGLEVAEKMHWLSEQARIFESMGIGQYRANDMDGAITHWLSALELYKQDTLESADSKSILKLASVNYNVAITNFQLGNYLETIFHIKNALELYLKLDNKVKVNACYNIMSLANFEQDNIKEAEKYASQSLQLSLEMQDSSAVSSAYNTLAGVYLETDQYEKALEYFNASLRYENPANVTVVQHLKMNIGQTYTHMGAYDSAQILLEEGVAYFSSTDDMASQITSLNLLCDLYEAQKKWDKIILLSKKSLSLMENLPLLKQQREAYENLYLAYENTGQTSLAYDHFKKFTSAKDSMVNEKKTKEIERLRAQLEYEEQEREIGQLTEENLFKELQLEQERNTRNLILLSAFLLFLLGGFLWLGYKRKQEQKQYTLDMKRVEIEQRMLRSQMNPHFIFNALNSIQSFITTNKGYEAEVFMSKFSMLVRKILENSTHKFISLEEEIDTLRLYLELEKSRFEERFDFDIVEEADTTLSIPPMLLQPFIENAIIHGMKGKKDKGNIHVRFIEEDEHLRCEVEDNGVGRSAEETEKEHNSLATSLTNDRIKYFNEASGSGQYELDILDLKKQQSQEPCGTKVILTIPIQS